MEKFLGKIGIYKVYLLLQMDDSILKNILTKIGEVNPKYTLDKQVYNVGDLIQFIDNPSEEVQLAAVKENGLSIKYIQNPSERVQLAAVKEIPYSIQHIKNPSERVQLAAVEENPYSIHYIKNPSERVKDLYREKISLPKKIITRIGKKIGPIKRSEYLKLWKTIN